MKNKANLKKWALIVVSAMLLVCVSVGATVAYLTAKTDTVVNTFTVGKVAIDLTETDVKPDGTKDTDARVKANEYHLLPGHTYIKDPTVTIKANSEEAYVRMKVEVKNVDKLKEVFPKDVAADGTFLLQNFVNNTWDNSVWAYTKCDVSDNDAVYEFRYVGKTTVAENDQNLAPLFKEIKIPGEGIDGDAIAKLETVKINITAEAIQADSFATADDAWKAFN